MVKVAILGYGTVGSGVAQVLCQNKDAIARSVGDAVQVKYILDVRDFDQSPYGGTFVKDFSVIEEDPEVSVVVETIGGATVALNFTQRALSAGKHVVTSNKELVACHGLELTRLAQEKGVCYLFEASVGGGIPIIRPLTMCLAANQMEEVCGILNGTTNYILTRMIGAGLSFEAALKEAQENGYAERDPSADILGYDACRKICILADLSFGKNVDPQLVPTEGITGITLADVDYADGAGKKIKLLGRALRQPDGRVCAYVAPHLVDGSHPLAGVEDVFNAVLVKGDAVGEVMFYGPGAGKLPTASAVVADVMDIARSKGARPPITWEQGDDQTLCGTDELASRFYVRVQAGADALRTHVGEIKLLARGGAAAGETAGITEQAMTEQQLRSKLEGMEVLSLIRVLN